MEHTNGFYNSNVTSSPGADLMAGASYRAQALGDRVALVRDQGTDLLISELLIEDAALLHAQLGIALRRAGDVADQVPPA